MADDPNATPGAAAPNDEVVRRDFSTGFRGFDTAEVIAHLEQVAERLGAAEGRAARMRHRIAQLEHQLSVRPEPAPQGPPPADEQAMLEALGTETANILRTAHEAAAETTARGHREAERIVREATEEAARIRLQAEGLLATWTREAESRAAKIVASAGVQADEIKATAKGDAEALVEQGRRRAREVVEDAQTTKERILGDLLRRRKVAQVQIEQLRAGRDRLLDAYRTVRRTLDEVTGELQRADAEARAAAEAVGRRAAEEAAAATGRAAATRPVRRPRRTAEPPAASAALAAPAVSAAERSATPSPSPSREAASSVPEPVTVGGELAAGAATAEPAEPNTFTEVIVGDRPVAGVRILRATPGPAASPDAASADPASSDPASLNPAAPSEPAAPFDGDVGALPEDGPVHGGVLDEPTPEDAIAEGDASWADDLLAFDPSEAPLPEEEAASAENGTPETERASGAPVSPGRQAVDELFARIRAERAEKVAHAHEVLGGGEGGGRGEGDGRGEAGTGVMPGPVAAARATSLREVPVPDADEIVLQQRDAALQGIEESMTRKLKRALQDEQNDLLDRLRGVTGRTDLTSLLPTAHAQAERYRLAAMPFLSEAAEAGSGFYPGGTAEVARVDDIAGELAAAIAGPLRRRLEAAVQESAGDDASGIAEHIGAAYREWKTQRIEQVAGDHTTAAFAIGVLTSSPQGTAWRWVVDDQGAACPDCDDNALAGPTTRGEVFPTGQPHPPAHAGCRCLLVPARR